MKSLFPTLVFCLVSGRALSFHADPGAFRCAVPAGSMSRTDTTTPPSRRYTLGAGSSSALGVGGQKPLEDFEYDEEECELFEMGYRPREIRRLPCPNPDLSAEDVVELCMTHLLDNDEPRSNAGLEVCFLFSSDRCRAAKGGSLEEFVRYASNPTFGSMIGAREWTKASVGPVIAGTNTRGALQTVLVDVKPSGGRDRRFLWTLQQERRPPRQGCWMVHECIFVDNAYTLTL